MLRIWPDHPINSRRYTHNQQDSCCPPDTAFYLIMRLRPDKGGNWSGTHRRIFRCTFLSESDIGPYLFWQAVSKRSLVLVRPGPPERHLFTDSLQPPVQNSLFFLCYSPLQLFYCKSL